MSSPRRPPADEPDDRLLAAPLRGGATLVDRLVLALALAPRPGSGSDSPLAPAWRRRRRDAPRRG